MLSPVTSPGPGEMCAFMIVSEQFQPPVPPITLLCPDLESDPSSMMFSASLYFGGRCVLSAGVMWPMLSSFARTVKCKPSTMATRTTVTPIDVQAMIRARIDGRDLAGRDSSCDRPDGPGRPFLRDLDSLMSSSGQPE